MLTILDLHRATVARLDAHTTNVSVFEGEADLPLSINEWAVLQPGAGKINYQRLARTVVTVDWPVAIMCGGRTVEDVLDCVQQVRDALQGWDVAPDQPSATLMIEDEVDAPILPYQSVEGDTRYTITPTYRVTHDR